MSKYQPVALLLAIFCHFYSIDAKPKVMRNQQEIMEFINIDWFDGTGPDVPWPNLCKEPDDFKQIVCNEVMGMMSKYGVWDTTTQHSAQYQCNEANIATASKSTWVFKCTNMPYNRTKDPREADILQPPYLNGIYIGQSNYDPAYTTYVYTPNAMNELVCIFKIYEFSREEHVAVAQMGSWFGGVKMNSQG